ncbi:hypothetical protein FQZ97_960920 [compost metagenome]
MLDALGHPHGRPESLAVVVGRDRRVKRGQRGVGIQQRRAAQHHLLIALVAGQEDRAAHRGQGAIPAQQLAIHQVFALLDGRTGTEALGDFGSSGEQGIEIVVVGHCTFLWIGATGNRF